ncbi:hypothetical protein MCUN1_001255 [Malassezia cuniculi]|uniref:Letm1 RBD domain-containing protein n=1 Tax=Malassezia cuniculi TaxID=948313 RepID=A0AAF0ETJ8_9BASI|nr:hypothetical protein MCUN1_001255 [Malassezia cuniculi]
MRAGLAPRVLQMAGRTRCVAIAPHMYTHAYVKPRQLHISRPRLSESRPDDQKSTTAVEKFKPAEPAETAKPTKPLTIRERISNAWSTVKYLFRFYMNGVKQIWRNREIVKKIQEDVKLTGRSLTWEETQLFRTHSSDMRKLPLFLLILVTIEELLPLMVIYTPFLLPSTCILPSQRTSIMKHFEVKRKAAVVELRRHVDEDHDFDVPVIERTDEPDLAGATLAQVAPERVRELAVVYNQSLWGGTALQRRRIARHLAMLRDDDSLLASSEVMRSPEPDVALLEQACTERGIRAVNTEPQKMRDLLGQWLLYTSGRPLTTLSLAFLPVRLSSPVDMVSIQLEREIAEQNRKGIVEQTSTIVKEVVEEEKRIESK